jgi:hypothetical protein
LLEFVPGGVELTLRALVGYSIKTGIFDQNIEAVQEGPC